MTQLIYISNTLHLPAHTVCQIRNMSKHANTQLHTPYPVLLSIQTLWHRATTAKQARLHVQPNATRVDALATCGVLSLLSPKPFVFTVNTLVKVSTKTYFKNKSWFETPPFRERRLYMPQETLLQLPSKTHNLLITHGLYICIKSPTEAFSIFKLKIWRWKRKT